MFDIIAIGDATLDTYIVIEEASLDCKRPKKDCRLCFEYGKKIPINTIRQSVGGNSTNMAVGCRKLGLKSIVHTMLGDDFYADIIKTDLKSFGLPVGLVQTYKNTTTNNAYILNYKAERTVLSYHGAHPYKLPKLPKTKWIYYTSLSKGFGSFQKQLLKYLKKHPSVRLAVNPGSYQLKYGLKTVKSALKNADLLIVNKEEAGLFVGKRKSVKPMINDLHKIGVKMAVITDGINGSYASEGKGIYFMPAYDVKAVARTGAGDAYSSGFMSALIYKKTLEHAMRWGTANAAGVIQKFGAHKGLFNKTAMLRFIKKYKKITPRKI